MTEELKPCLFCGGSAEHIGHYWYDGNYAGDYVRCTKCNVRNERQRLVSDPTTIDAWNTRAKAMTSEPSGIPGEFGESDWVLVHLNGVRKGREAERAKIVAWLRECGNLDDQDIADLIEAGGHLK